MDMDDCSEKRLPARLTKFYRRAIIIILWRLD
jgi:hypothetical protein